MKNILVDAVSYRIEPTDEILILDGQEVGATVDYNLGVGGGRRQSDSDESRACRADYEQEPI